MEQIHLLVRSNKTNQIFKNEINLCYYETYKKPNETNAKTQQKCIQSGAAC